jgi:putative endonuclease
MNTAASSHWHLYLVRTRTGTLYTGIATDIERRFAEHQSQSGKCARYLCGRAPLQLVFSRRIGSRSLALKAEGYIKKLPKTQKERLIRSPRIAKALFAQFEVNPDHSRKE